MTGSGETLVVPISFTKPYETDDGGYMATYYFADGDSLSIVQINSSDENLPHLEYRERDADGFCVEAPCAKPYTNPLGALVREYALAHLRREMIGRHLPVVAESVFDRVIKRELVQGVS